MRTTFSPRAEIDYYPITAAFPIMHTSYDLIRWLRTLSTESHEVMIPRSTTIHFQTAAWTGEAARTMHDEEERKRDRGVRYVKYARSTIPIFRPDRISKRG